MDDFSFIITWQGPGVKESGDGTVHRTRFTSTCVRDGGLNRTIYKSFNMSVFQAKSWGRLCTTLTGLTFC